MKHIAVFTSSRSDWGILETLVRAMRQTTSLKITILASGSHFDPRFGATLSEIETNYSGITVSLDAGYVGNTPLDASVLAGRILELTGRWFSQSFPDAVIILGDRFEALSCAAAAVLHRIPILHLHGGEITVGAVDDSIRHALSKLALLHFPVHEDYERRLIQMGENPNSIVVSGSLAVEGMKHKPLLSRSDLGSLLEMEIPERFVVCAVHPVTTSATEVGAILDALQHVFYEMPELPVILTAPAPDPGFEEIENRFFDWCTHRPDIFSYRASVGSSAFLSLTSCSLGLVGNSSSGLLEIPSLGVPTLNIGSRQKGRLRATSVIDAKATVREVKSALQLMTSAEFQEVARETLNPIMRENPSRVIIETIEHTDLVAVAPKIFRDLEVRL